MINDALLAFFLITPAVISVLTAREQAHSLSRFVLFWGGLLASVVVSLALLPALGCGGLLYESFSSCIGGQSATSAANAAAPVIRLILLTYVLIAPVVAVVCFALNTLAKRPQTGL